MRISGLLAALALWQIAALTLASPFFPPLSSVLPAMWRMMVDGNAWGHGAVSLRVIIEGFVCAAGAGTLLGVGMAEFPQLHRVLSPVIDAMRPVAALTLFPLIILVLGLGNASKVFVIFWTAWPAVLLNTVQAICDVDSSVLEAACLDGAGPLALLFTIKLPLALPVIMTGLRVAMSGGWISLVAAEMLGSSAGLGHAVLVYSQTFRFPEMYAAILIIALMGLLLNSGLAGMQAALKLLYS